MKRLYLLIALLITLQVWVYRRVLLPLRVLAANAKRLSSGDFTALEQHFSGSPEVDTLRSAMNAMVGHVRRAQAQEWAYLEALTNGQEAERARIAHELHDDTTQSLIAIAQSLEIAQGLLEPSSPASTILTSARTQAIQTVDNLRRLIANLRPPILAELGLVPALQVLAEGTHQAVVRIVVAGTVRRLSEAKELALFRSVQEALQNALRHGQAQRITVQLIFQPEAIQLVIEDEGLGFDPPQEFDQLAANGHYGLVGIHERVQHLEGDMTIVSQPQQGTRLEIVIPSQDSWQPGEVVRDPVCSAVIQPQQAYASLEYQGERYYFCCPVCEGAFKASPKVYLHKPSYS